MPRPERRLDPDADDVQRLACALRELRQKAGSPPYRQLARLAHYSPATLAEAAGGRKLPSLAVTLAYVRACGGDEQQWDERWREIAHAPDDAPDDRSSEARVPYVGLAAFQPRDADRFFGRDSLIRDLQALVAQRRLVGVFGASGSGKSSLLRAGLVGKSDDPAVVFTPSTDPVEECAVHLAALTGGSAASWRDDLAADPANLHLRIRQAMAHDEGDLLLVIDQFEEIFTLSSDEGRDWLIRALTTAASADTSRVRIVLGARADFYGHCGQHPQLVEALRGGQVLVGPMTPDELREAITAPAVRVGYTVETALVARLVADAAGQPAVLPLVSHALLETWRRRHGMTLTLTGYEAVGGIHYSVAHTAEDIYHQLEPDQQKSAQQLFLRLITIGDGAEDTKRRISIGELDGDLATVLDRLTDARLLVVDQGGVEMIHEALIQHWPRLRNWLEEDRDGLRIHRHLTETAHAWESLNHDPEALLRGTRLARTHEWATIRDFALTARERRFLNASVQARDNEKARARKRNRRLRQLVAVAVVFALLTATAAVAAIQQRSMAIQQRDDAVFRQVVAEADRLKESDPSLSAQLNLVAHRMRPTDQDVHTRLLATQHDPLAMSLVGHTGKVYATSFSPDGHTLVTASQDGSVRLWDVRDRTHPQQLGPPLTGHLVAWSVAFSPDGHTLATAGVGSALRLWNVTEPSNASPLGPPLTADDGDMIYHVAFSPDGRTLATANENHTVRLWNLTDPAHATPLDKRLTGHSGLVRSVAFSPDGRTLAVGGEDTTVQLWDVTDPGNPVRLDRRLVGHTLGVRAMAFSPDGHVLATASDDGTVRLWNANDGAVLGFPLTHTGEVVSVRFSPSNPMLATVGAQGTVRLWNASDPSNVRQFGQPIASSSHIYAVEFSPDGRTLATGNADSTAQLWALPTALLIGHRTLVDSTDFSPNGRLMATGGRDATVRLWDTANPAHPTPLGQIPAAPGYSMLCGMFCSSRVRFSPNGHVLAVLSYAKIIQLWNVTDPAYPTPLALTVGVYHARSVSFSPNGHTLATGATEVWDVTEPRRPIYLAGLAAQRGYINSAEFSADGRLLATASSDNTIRLWNVTDLRRPIPLGQHYGHTDHAMTIAFHPDGRTLASGSADQTVRLWDIIDPDHPKPLGNALNGHTKTVHTVVFSPDGRTLASASDDHTIRLWNTTDLSHPTPIGQPIPSSMGAGNALTFSPDGRFLALADGAGTVRLLDLDLNHAIQRICETTQPPSSRHREFHLAWFPHQPPCAP